MKKSLYVVHTRTPDRLQIDMRSGRHVANLIATVGFFAVWYTVLLTDMPDGASRWLFLLAPLLFLGELYRPLRVIIWGESWALDRVRDTVSRGDKVVGTCGDFEALQIRVYVDSDDDEDYRLSLVKADGNKIFVDRASNRAHIDELAEEMADFLDVSVRIKR